MATVKKSVKKDVAEVVESVAEAVEVKAEHPEVSKGKKAIIELLESMGVTVDTTKSIEQLNADLKEHITGLQKSAVSVQTATLQSKINHYKADSNLTSDEFIARLIEIGVPDIYVKGHVNKDTKMIQYLFNDIDSGLSDKDIWRKIRASRINVIGTDQLFRRPAKRVNTYGY